MTRGCLERIEQLNPSPNAFITVTAESAMKEAGAAELDFRSVVPYKQEVAGSSPALPTISKDSIR